MNKNKKTPQQRVAIPERHDVLTYIQENTATVEKTIAALALQKNQIQPLTLRIQAMVRDNQLSLDEHENLVSNEHNQRIGKVVRHPHGFGFLQLADETDWYISEYYMQRCLPGEQVVATPKSVDKKGTSAHIVTQHALLKNVTVQFFASPQGWKASLDGSHKVPVKIVMDAKAVDGMWALGDFTAGPSGKKPHHFTVSEIIDTPTPIDAIRYRALQQRGFPVSHGQVVEAAAMKSCVQEPRAIMDKRDIPFCSIDGASSRDLDDLVYAKKIDTGYKVIVAIADVSSIILPDSVLDIAARERSVSVYTAGKSFPMLPSVISHNACSMLPNADRNALVVEMLLDQQGEMISYEFSEAQVRSAIRLTYQRAQAIHEGDATRQNESSHATMLSTLYDVQALRSEIRSANGGFFIESQEPCIRFNPEGEVDSFGCNVPVRSNKVIEEIMVLANIAAATFLSKGDDAAIYRHHPGLEGSDVSMLNSYLEDFALPHLQADSNSSTCNERGNALPEDARPHFYRLLRSAMTNARYDTCNSSHFGMALPLYTHFTSPIRRYADILTHRLIKQRLQAAGATVNGEASYTQSQLQQHADLATQRSYDASLVERDVLNRITCRWWASQPQTNIQARIVASTETMFFARLGDTPAEGAMRISDYFKHTDQAFEVGMTIMVNITDIDENAGRIAIVLNADVDAPTI
jgi:ribonuclease R